MKRLVLVAAILAGCGNTEATTDDAGGGAGGAVATGGVTGSGGAGGARADAGAPPTCVTLGCPFGSTCEADGHCENREIISMQVTVSNQYADFDLRWFDPANKTEWPTTPAIVRGGASSAVSVQCTKFTSICYGGTMVLGAAVICGLGPDGTADCKGSCCLTCMDYGALGMPTPVVTLSCKAP